MTVGTLATQQELRDFNQVHVAKVKEWNKKEFYEVNHLEFANNVLPSSFKPKFTKGTLVVVNQNLLKRKKKLQKIAKEKVQVSETEANKSNKSSSKSSGKARVKANADGQIGSSPMESEKSIIANLK